MTGEITLSGLVLPVGGIKEKSLAARRAGIRRIILPRANEKDLRELPQELREDMEFLLAERIDDVLTAAIPGMPGQLGTASRSESGDDTKPALSTPAAAASKTRPKAARPPVR